MKLNIISQVWPKWYEVSKTVESKPSKNHLDSIWKVDQPARNMLWCIRSLFRRGEPHFQPARGWLLATPPPSCVSSARLTVRGPSSVRFSGTTNATRQVWRRFVGSVAGWFSFGSNKWAGKASRVTCTLWSCHKEVVVCENTFFLFWMAVFGWLCFGVDCRCLTIRFDVFRIFFLLVWSPTKFHSEMRLYFERLLDQVSFSGLRNSWAFTKSPKRRIYIRSRQDMRSFLLPTQIYPKIKSQLLSCCFSSSPEMLHVWEIWRWPLRPAWSWFQQRRLVGSLFHVDGARCPWSIKSHWLTWLHATKPWRFRIVVKPFAPSAWWNIGNQSHLGSIFQGMFFKFSLKDGV